MANLLTNDTKQNLQRDLLGRKLAVAGLVFGFWLTIGLITLGSFWASLFIRDKGLASLSVAPSGNLKTEQGPSDPVAWLKKIETEVKTVDNYWSEPLVSTMIAKTLGLKPIGLKILGFIVDRGEVGQATKLSFVGLASSRNQLVDYVNRLRQDKFFSRIDLPVESLLSDQGGQFVINLEK